MFRHKRAISSVSYNEQGYIFFLCRRYNLLPAEKRETVREGLQVVEPEYRKALLEFMTTSKGMTEICGRHHVSERTMHRAVNKYYIYMAEQLRSGNI